ncbi:MAG: ABC transporter permease subunit [Candidatus Faecousia sp.]|nr:ABC transporter permease subunit [Candidatus Faecousia sp.]
MYYTLLKNFEFLFKTKDFYIIMRNTLCYNLVFIFGGLAASLAIAVMMTEIGNWKIAKVIQPVICFPNMVSIVIVAYLVYGFLGGDGWINNTLLHGNGIFWYSKPQYWPYILTFVHFWKGAGYGSIIYIATMSGIDKGLYEAARLDGASKWQQIRLITLPIIRPMIILMLLMSILTEGANLQGLQLPTISARMAIAMIAVLPVALIFPFVQSQLIKGVVIGGVKG